MQAANDAPIPVDQTLKERERDKIAADVAAFLRGGGQIEQVAVTRHAGPYPDDAASNEAFEADD